MTDGKAKPLRVLVVEDAAATRELLVQLLVGAGFEVVGTASDGETAVEQARQLRPDVITMDIYMPHLDGVSATRRIMAEVPTPIVVLSAGLDPEAQLGFEALRAGALAVLDKPPGPGHPRHAALARELVTTLRLMAEVPVVRRKDLGASSRTPLARGVRRTNGDAYMRERLPERPSHPSVQQSAHRRADPPRPQLVALAASTGGPLAIQTLLRALGPDVGVPILVVQHISRGFEHGMAGWLTATCPFLVRIAAHGDTPQPNVVYLAADDRHLLMGQRGALVLSKAPPVQGFRPSANVLFESLAESLGGRAIGIILTGMGEDGASGLSVLRAAGAPTIAQDAASSVVYGMPRAAAEIGAASYILSLAEIGSTVRDLLGLAPSRTL